MSTEEVENNKTISSTQQVDSESVTKEQEDTLSHTKLEEESMVKDNSQNESEGNDTEGSDTEGSDTEDDSEYDIIDVTDDPLYQVLSAFFETEEGENLCDILKDLTKVVVDNTKMMSKMLKQ